MLEEANDPAVFQRCYERLGDIVPTEESDVLALGGSGCEPALQLRVARGEPLPLALDDVRLDGHAIEARLYAEDPSEDFLPATGSIDLWRPPVGDGVRVDAGIATGGAISPYYDPMLAKIIAHGATREDARARLVAALRDTALFGVASNRRFLIDALSRPAFIEGAATTAFIAENFTDADLQRPPLGDNEAAIAAALLFLDARRRAAERAVSPTPALFNWSSATPITTPYRFGDADTNVDVALTPTGPDAFTAALAEKTIEIKVVRTGTNEAVLELDGARRRVLFDIASRDACGQTIHLGLDGRDVTLTNLNGVRTAAGEAAGAGAVLAPMHGALVDILVKKGDSVSKGDRLAILEAMKMQHELTAAIDGEVGEILFEAGAQVAADTLLMEITPRDA